MTEEELVALTPSVSAQDLDLAYENLIFPWPVEGLEGVPWFSPNKRGVLFFKDLHLSKSLKKEIKRNKFQVSFCQDFKVVITACAQVQRKGQEGTWITAQIIKAYTDLFNQGRAYSVEVWRKDKLVGGLYGVISRRYLSGESMFHTETSASKIALVKLVERLQTMGLSYIDTQMVSPLLDSLGAKELDRKSFRKLTEESIILDESFCRRLKDGESR